MTLAEIVAVIVSALSALVAALAYYESRRSRNAHDTLAFEQKRQEVMQGAFQNGLDQSALSWEFQSLIDDYDDLTRSSQLEVRQYVQNELEKLRGFKAKLDDWKLEMQVVREGLKTYDGQLKSSVRNIQIEEILGTVREMRIFLDRPYKHIGGFQRVWSIGQTDLRGTYEGGK